MHHGNIFKEKFFTQCPNCKQTFQGDVYYDLTKAQLSFIEREFKDVENWHVEAMVMRMTVLDVKKNADRIEGEEISAKILSMIEDDMGTSISSVEFLILAYKCIGMFYYKVGDDESLEKAKKCYEKARGVYNTLGGGEVHETLIFMAKTIEEGLAKVEARLNGNSLPETAVFDLSTLQDTYKHMSQNLGENDIMTMQCGVRLARDLFEASHTIEALRLLDKLLLTSRRVHGASHKQTKDAEYLWQRLKIRYVEIGNQPYQALRYEKDGDSYVVNGPVPANLLGKTRYDDDEDTFSISSGDVSFTVGLPVMLHGLTKAAHLNDKIGDIRDRCALSNRFIVHLEGKGLKPVKVKQENLRIVLDLPDPKK